MNNPTLELLTDAFCKACNEVFSRSLATDWQFTASGKASADGPAGFSLELVQTKADGKIAIQLSVPDASQIIEKILGEPVPPTDEVSADNAEIVQSVLEESASATLADSRLGLSSEVLATVATPEWEPAAVLIVSGSDGETGPIELHLLISPELLSAISVAPSKTAAATTRSNSSSATSVSDTEPITEDNLGLVMDVELDLTLRFGRQLMTLKDILALAPGSVVELDRDVHEPVDLVLGEKVIARGEVVIVEGNYGLRVTEVCNSEI